MATLWRASRQGEQTKATFYVRRSLTAGWIFLCAFLLGWTTLVRATDNYEYQPGEYAVVSGGQSPDGRWSVAAHGDGYLGYDQFGLYLLREPSHEKVSALPTGDHLDTAPLSIVAIWAPDSGRVVVLHRADRHVLDLRLFRVKGAKLASIKVPSLAETVGRGRFKQKESRELVSRYYRVTWLQPDRFRLGEFDVFQTAAPFFRAGLEAYVKVERLSPTRCYTSFSAGATCEITRAGKLRLSQTEPLPGEERTITYSPHLRVDPELGLHDTETSMSSIERQKNQR